MSILYNKTEEFFKKEIKDGTNKLGLLHNAYHEEMPTFEQAGCEFAYPDANYGVGGGAERRLNCQIVFGRDRPSHLLSGYGKIGGKPCASIDIVAGRMSGANKKKGVFKKYIETVKRDTVVGNNFALDASRIYISQKCDIDDYFGLPPGDFGRPRGEAGIGIKSDHVRLVGRDSVKICAGGGQFENLGKKGELNSNGDRLIDPRIEFIAGSEETQPIVKGSNLVELLNDMMDQISSLEQAFLLQNSNIAVLKAALASHFHIGAGAGAIVVSPDPILATKCLADIPVDLQKIQNNVTKCLNFEIIKLNYLGIGVRDDDPKFRLKTEKNILSRTVHTT